MGRAPCCSKVGLHRGPWTAREDTMLVNYIHKHGEGQWRTLPKNAGLLRCGKSCRLRWVNYLRPDIKRGNISQDEEELILRLHSLLGNRWSLIAGRLPGRTDNEIKNYWNSHLSKRLAYNVNHNTTPKLTDDDDDKKSENANSRFEKVTKITDKIHQPKPIRVCPSSFTRNNGMAMLSTGSFSSCPHQLEDVTIDCRNFIHQECIDLCSSPVPAKDDNNDMLDKIYKEYQQLLNKPDQDQQNSDSFVNSLLV